MRKRMMKLISLLLSVSMTFSAFTMPVHATTPADDVVSEQAEDTEVTVAEDAVDTTKEEQPEETRPEVNLPEEVQPKTTEPEVTVVEESFTTYTLNTNDLYVSNVSPTGVVVEEGFEADTSNPVITTIEDELNSIKVLSADEDGTKQGLTEEQTQQVLYMFQQYLDQAQANANVLGVQLPFFLSYNDKGEDGLGILGEMLVLAGKTVEQVRTGEYSFDDLMGMIQNFLYADKFGVELYGDTIAKKRNEVLQKVKDSGAKTTAQKLLVINDWLAHEATFDMAYIMNMGKENPVMVAENPQKHEHYDYIYNEMYNVYYQQIEQQFKSDIKAGIEAQLRQQFYEGEIKDTKYKQVLGKEESEATEDEKNAAKAQAEEFMTQNEEAIKADAPGFVKETFGEEEAARISAAADQFIEKARTEGVEVQPGVTQTIDDMVAYQMDQPMEKLNGASPNQAIPEYAKQAAEGLTGGILGAWEGNHIGILAEGTGVCAGYSKAFAYLVQYMNPGQYGKNGANTDMSISENWKTTEELYFDENGDIDIDKGYLVDMVRITFDADVSMFGEDSNFGETHFWNAVKVDGKWYYVDPCYTDIYVECMSRDRVEIDGTMNHMYFMFSHDTAEEMYNGNMKEIATLYDKAANDTSYEDSWFARIASNTYFSSNKAYYMYDSTDQLAMMREYRDLQNSGSNNIDESQIEALQEGNDPTYKLVYHTIGNSDTKSGGADSDFTSLIEFNYKANEDDEESVARVYNPKTRKMVENELITKLFAQYKAERDIYPSIKMTTALHDGKLYFNLSNCILSYEISSGTVEVVKEYNTVYGKRDNTNPFGGMAFSVVKSADEADLSVTNHPIAALTIKDDGKMYVSVATNYAFISGKSSVDDTSSYGYEFEESNYNPNYNSYMKGNDAQMEAMGYKSEDNDNDEFMWSAVFVDTINMEATCSHTYEAVTIAPTCGRDGYTENRCTACGVAEADSRVVDEDSALDAHHYVHFDEQYYTKKNGKFNTGECYVCTVCGFAVEEPTKPKDNADEEEKEAYEKNKALWDDAVATAGHSYEPVEASWSEDSTAVTFSKLECSSVCPDRKSYLDCLLDDNKIAVTCKETTATAEVVGHEGICDEGLTDIYVAEGETADGHKFTAINKVKKEPGEHSYVADLVWEKATSADAEVPYTATATKVTCDVCQAEVEGALKVDVKLNEEKSTKPSCEETGKNVYTATVTVTDDKGAVLATVTEDKSEESDVIPATGHTYGEPTWDWTLDEDGRYTKVTATFKCEVCESNPTVEAKLTKKVDRNAGKTYYTATVTVDGKEYTDKKDTAISEKDMNPFVDVSEEDYYYDPVLWALDKNITTGVDASHFAPKDECTRAQVVTFLWRAVGTPEPKDTTKNPFVDLGEDAYYYKAVLWAYENGITTGKDSTHFVPDEKVSRGQFVTFLYRAKEKPEVSAKNPFVDVKSGEYYTEAVLWAYENKITTGTDSTHFEPEAICIRGDVVTFLYRAYVDEK